MRILSSARIVVLDAEPVRRAALCSELLALGLLQVLPAGSLEEARRHASAQAVDLCVVDLRALADPIAAAVKPFPPNPLGSSRTPAILIANDATRESARNASASGYVAVLAHPVVPRHLYRRIGSLLQRARRLDRRKSAQLVADAVASGAELQGG